MRWPGRRAPRPGGATVRREHSYGALCLRSALFSLWFILLSLSSASPLAAQKSTAEGLTLGVHVGSVSVHAGEADRATGGGGGVLLGYGLTRGLTIFARVDGANIELDDSVSAQGTWVVGHVDLGARFHFADPRRSYAPYLEGALTRRIVEVTELPQPNVYGADRIRFSGGVFTLGGGVLIYANASLAFDLGVRVGGGEFTSVTIGETRREGFDLATRSTRLNIGVAWWL